ncbi:MAG: B12-binding domain-containing radical SAM protein [Planctomycetota bacterium]|jgi:radical SAM superfamily enzyme YgiQ (UPF0313 family)
MKVLFISANTETLNMRTLPWGMACVAAAVREAGHEAAMLDLMGEADPAAAVAAAIGKHNPDVIGVSVRNIDDQNRGKPVFFLPKVKEIVTVCRNITGVPVVLGGAGYSIFPQTALEFLGADMGIQGEGELAFPALLSRLKPGAGISDSPGLYLPGKGLQGKRIFSDMRELPLPGDELFENLDPETPGLMVPVQASRGCNFACSYCSTSTIEGKEIRKRRAEKVIDWLERRAAEGFRSFFFVDNNFNIPPEFALDFCNLLAKRQLDIGWRCILNPMRVGGELLDSMRAAGCTDVSLGFETGCEVTLKSLGKKFTLDEVVSAGAMLKKSGINRMGFLLLGGPGETRETVKESLAFADSLGFEMMRLTAGIRIYPDTQLAKTAVSEGVISAGDDLLFPRFYLAPGLEGWIEKTIEKWCETRPNWIF